MEQLSFNLRKLLIKLLLYNSKIKKISNKTISLNKKGKSLFRTQPANYFNKEWSVATPIWAIIKWFRAIQVICSECTTILTITIRSNFTEVSLTFVQILTTLFRCRRELTFIHLSSILWVFLNMLIKVKQKSI
jgi:hypothetical protein